MPRGNFGGNPGQKILHCTFLLASGELCGCPPPTNNPFCTVQSSPKNPPKCGFFNVAVERLQCSRYGIIISHAHCCHLDAARSLQKISKCMRADCGVDCSGEQSALVTARRCESALPECQHSQKSPRCFQYQRRRLPTHRCAIVSKLVDKEPRARIDLLRHVMESRGLTRKDMEPYIGNRARVSEVLNRARPLTLAMIRRLSDALNLPADVLVKEYAAKAA